MKKYYFSIGACLIAIHIFAQDDVVKSRWAKEQIVADGLIADWKSNIMLFDKETKISYQIANDSSNIYFLFEVKDQQTQMRIIHSGLSLEIIKKEKPKRKAYIKYPINQNLEEPMQMNPGFSPSQEGRAKNPGDTRSMSDQQKNLFKLRSEMMEIKGFQREDGVYSARKSNSIKVGIDWSIENTMYYEVCIPIREYYSDSFYAGYIKTIPLTFKLTLNALERPNYGPPGGGRRPGDGIGPGGGMGPGGASVRVGMGPGKGRNNATFTSINFKQEFQLVFE